MIHSVGIVDQVCLRIYSLGADLYFNRILQCEFGAVDAIIGIPSALEAIKFRIYNGPGSCRTESRDKMSRHEAISYHRYVDRTYTEGHSCKNCL